MKNKFFASLAVATTLGLLIPAESHAFGLGNLKVNSALNQPLSAEIPLTAVSATDQDNIQVRLASDDEFTKAGLQRTFLLSKLKFNVVYSDNKPRIIISSDEPIREPFLDFLITATSGEGQLIREYTVLLDPPKQIFNEAPAVSAQPVASPSSSNQPVSQSQNTTSQTAAPGQYGPTSRSDTLWHIASKTLPQQSLSVNQMMMALLKANPKAFQGDNINGLKSGYTLDIPTVAQISELSRSQALAAVRDQNRAWKNRSNSATPAAQGDQTRVTANETAAPAQAGVVAPAQPSSDQQPASGNASATPANQAKLELVSPEEKQNLNDDKQAPQGDKKITHLTQQLTLAQEAIEAQNQENDDIKQRMSMMEEQLKTLHRLINLKDKDLARMQSLLDKEQKAPAGAATDASSVADETLAAMGQNTENQINLLGDSPATATDNQTQQSAAQTADKTTTPATPAASDNKQQPAAETPAQQPQAAASQSAAVTNTTGQPESQVDEVVDKTAEMLNLNKDEVHSVFNKVKLFVLQHQLEAGLGALLILLILLLIIRRRNRVVPWDEAVEDIDKNDTTRVVSPTQPVTEEPLAAPEVTEINEPMPDVRAKTVDELVEQADMFVGYADYVQAKSSLEQAHAQEPDNTRVIQKLLFVLYKQKQTDAFVNMAQSAELDRDSEEWQDIAAWGRELAPANLLFVPPVEATENDSVESETGDIEHVADAQEVDETADLSLDFSHDEQSQPVQTEEVIETEQVNQTKQDEGHLEFDLSDYDFNNAQQEDIAKEDELPSAETAETEQQDQEGDLLNFDLGTVADNNDTLTLDVDEEPEAEQTSEASPAVDAAEQHETLNTLNFDVEPVSEDDNDGVDLQETELDAISDEELEAAAQALGKDEDDYYETDNLTQDLDFDIGEFDEIDEAETKLDLAAAYIDMGDPDGAKSILEEVVKEGNDEQKTRAQSLLQSITD